MLITPQKFDDKSFKLQINENENKKVSSAKYRGMTMVFNLKRNLHIQAVCKKVCKSAGSLSNIQYYVNEKNSKTFYGLVHSYLLYGILAWGSDFKTTIKPLQIIQNKVIRIINNVRQDGHGKTNSLYSTLTLEF